MLQSIKHFVEFNVKDNSEDIDTEILFIKHLLKRHLESVVSALSCSFRKSDADSNQTLNISSIANAPPFHQDSLIFYFCIILLTGKQTELIKRHRKHGSPLAVALVEVNPSTD